MCDIVFLEHTFHVPIGKRLDYRKTKH